jgi:hypothetical protein
MLAMLLVIPPALMIAALRVLGSVRASRVGGALTVLGLAPGTASEVAYAKASSRESDAQGPVVSPVGHPIRNDSPWE